MPATLKKQAKPVHVGVTVLDSKGNRVESVGSYRKGVVSAWSLPTGKYRVVLNGTNLSKKVTVKSGKTTKVAFARPTGTTISGTVLKPDGRPYARAAVLIEDGFGTKLGVVKTNGNGKYTIRGAVEGRYVVTAPQIVVRYGDTRAVKVKKGKHAKLNIRWSELGTLTGAVVTETGKPARTVRVLLEDSWGVQPRRHVVTGKDGRYKIKVRPGKYTITVSDETDRMTYFAGEDWGDPDGGYFHATSKSPVTLRSGKTKTAPTITVKTK